MQKFILSLAVAAGVAFASSTTVISFTALPGGGGWNGLGNGTTLSQSSTYNGEAQATVAGIPSQDLVCDDFTNTTYVPSGPLDYSVNTIATLTSSDVDFSSNFVTGLTGENANGMSQVQAYDTLAVLLTELEALTVNTADSQEITDLQYAMWDLTLPGANDGSGVKDSPLDGASAGSGTVHASPGATADLQSAFTAVLNNSTATQNEEKSLVIYTPAAGYTSNQEFLGINTPLAPVPEPSTWLLTSALGLTLCVPRVRSRLRHAILRQGWAGNGKPDPASHPACKSRLEMRGTPVAR